MDGGTKGPLAENEVLFREINEAIERGMWQGEGDEPAAFRCECARRGCTAMLSLTRAEYERVRAHSRRFLMVPGHELPDTERVVSTERGYVVVEKIDEPGELADARDPRG